MKKLWLIAATALAALTIYTGGTDAEDINRMIFVTGIGIDRSDDSFNYTFYTAVPTGSDTAVSDNNVSYESITLPSDSLAQAVRSLEMNSSRRISLEHLNCCALGASVTDGNVPAMLDYLLRDPGVRRQCALLALDGKAEDFFGAEYSGSIASGAAALLEQQDDSGSRGSLMTLGRLSSTVSSGSGYCLYILGLASGEETTSSTDTGTPAQIRLRGMAIYDSDGLTGRLSAQQTELARLFTSRQVSGVLTTVDEHGSRFVYEIRSSVCRTEFTTGIPPVGSFSIEIDCVPVESPNGIADFPTDDELAQSLYAQLNDLLDQSRMVGSAFTGLEPEARQRERVWYERNRGQWEDIYRSCLLELDVKCRIADGSE